jgi:hypothetical protein
MTAEHDPHNNTAHARDRALVRWLMGAVVLAVLIGVPGAVVASALPQLEIRIGTQPVPPYTIVAPAIFLTLIVAPVVGIFGLSACRRTEHPSSPWGRGRIVGVVGLGLGFLVIFPIIVSNSAEAISYSAAVSRGPTAEEASYTPEELEFVAQEVALDSLSALGGIIAEEPSNAGSIACETSNLQPGTEYLSDVSASTTDSPEVVQRTLAQNWKRFGTVATNSTSASLGEGGESPPRGSKPAGV